VSTSSDLGARARATKADISLPMLIRRSLELKREGRLWRGCRPFHNEKIPRFTVYPDRFHCFGCGASGDVIDWITRTRGLTFRKAIECLTGRPESRPVTVTASREPAVVRTDDGASAEWARRIWMESVSADDTLAERYLSARGLELPSGVVAPDESVIRFHPALWHKPSQQKLPAWPP